MPGSVVFFLMFQEFKKWFFNAQLPMPKFNPRRLVLHLKIFKLHPLNGTYVKLHKWCFAHLRTPNFCPISQEHTMNMWAVHACAQMVGVCKWSECSAFAHTDHLRTRARRPPNSSQCQAQIVPATCHVDEAAVGTFPNTHPGRYVPPCAMVTPALRFLNCESPCFHLPVLGHHTTLIT